MISYDLAKQLKDAGFPGIKFCSQPFHDSAGCTEEECEESIPTLNKQIAYARYSYLVFCAEELLLPLILRGQPILSVS